MRIGKESQLTLDAILMNAEVFKSIQKVKFEKLGETKECSVDGAQQVIGYTIFNLRTCK